MSLFNVEWTTKDGRKIRLRDMSDDHLFNTLLFCMRRLKELDVEMDATFSYQPTGDIASYYVAGAQNDSIHRCRAVRAWIEAFKLEIKRRTPPDPWG